MIRILSLMTLVITGCLASTAFAENAIFSVTSPQLQQGERMPQEQVFKGMGCQGENISPELRWSGAPADTKSYAVTMYDPDAPTGSGWWHWVVFNIPASINVLPKDAGSLPLKLLPEGVVQSRTDYGKAGYGGACPPPGDLAHRYFTTIWALDTPSLPLNSNASGAMVGYYLHQHALAKAVLMTTYQLEP